MTFEIGEATTIAPELPLNGVAARGPEFYVEVNMMYGHLKVGNTFDRQLKT